MVEKDKYISMECPACNDFIFSELDESDVESLDFLQCPQCGWVYDLQQVHNPFITTNLNKLSLNELRSSYQKKISQDPSYSFRAATYVASPHLCPVCQKHRFSDIGSFEICPVCGWQDDELMESEPDKWAGCSNELCLNDYKKQYEESKHD